MEQKSGRAAFDVRERLAQNYRRVEDLLLQLGAADDPRLRLAAAAELRQHIALGLRAQDSAAREAAVRAFEDAVMEALDQAPPSVRQKVIEALYARTEAADLLVAPGGPLRE